MRIFGTICAGCARAPHIALYIQKQPYIRKNTCIGDFDSVGCGESLIPRGGALSQQKEEKGKEGEKEGKKKRRGIQLMILLAISVLCSSIISYTMLKAFLLIKFALPQTHVTISHITCQMKIYVVSVVS